MCLKKSTQNMLNKKRNLRSVWYQLQRLRLLLFTNIVSSLGNCWNWTFDLPHARNIRATDVILSVIRLIIGVITHVHVVTQPPAFERAAGRPTLARSSFLYIHAVIPIHTIHIIPHISSSKYYRYQGIYILRVLDIFRINTISARYSPTGAAWQGSSSLHRPTPSAAKQRRRSPKLTPMLTFRRSWYIFWVVKVCAQWRVFATVW